VTTSAVLYGGLSGDWIRQLLTGTAGVCTCRQSDTYVSMRLEWESRF